MIERKYFSDMLNVYAVVQSIASFLCSSPMTGNEKITSSKAVEKIQRKKEARLRLYGDAEKAIRFIKRGLHHFPTLFWFHPI